MHNPKYFFNRYYLNLAASLPARTEYEAECVQKAKELADRLSEYDLTRDAILPHPI